MFGWTRQHYVIAEELRHARTSRNLAQSRAISRNLPPPPEGTIVRQGLHMSGGSPGKNGDGVTVRLATLTQWAVSAMLNTGRIHIFMRINLLYITRRTVTRARQSLAQPTGIETVFRQPDSRFRPSVGTSEPRARLQRPLPSQITRTWLHPALQDESHPAAADLYITFIFYIFP